eukprot:scaffold41_cov35-Prasinocladus_malaysianus.AAC.1
MGCQPPQAQGLHTSKGLQAAFTNRACAMYCLRASGRYVSPGCCHHCVLVIKRQKAGPADNDATALHNITPSGPLILALPLKAARNRTS